MRGFFVAWGLMLAAAAPAAAQTSIAASQATDAVTRGLVAQYQAALIRERRLADDRELRHIDAAETRMRDARHAFDTASSNRAQAQAALDACRTDYATLVESVELREAAARIEVEAFRAEISGSVPQATPELLAAYQQFADGDRQSAWTTLETLLTARANARVAAARAVAAAEVRQIASLREIMRVHGEATAAQVLALWDQAAELDPSSFWPHIYRARLRRASGDPSGAQTAAGQAHDTASDDHERSVASFEAARIAQTQGNFLAAGPAVREMLTASRQLATVDPNNPTALSDVAVGLELLGDIQKEQGDFDGAASAYAEEVQITRRLLSSDSDNAGLWKRNLAIGLARLGDALLAQTRTADARASYEESAAICRALAAADPANVEEQRGVVITVSKLGDIQMEQGDSAGAQRSYIESLTLSRRLMNADPSNAYFLRDTRVTVEKLGTVQQAQGDLAAARASFQEGLAIARRLSAIDSNGDLAQQDLAVSLQRLSDVDASRDDVQPALNAITESLGIRRRLAAADQSNAQRLRDVELALTRLGDLQIRRGDRTGARTSFEEGLAIARRLAGAQQSNMEWQRDVYRLMMRLVTIPESGVNWAQIVAFMEPLERRGALGAIDRARLDQARANAAREAQPH